MRESWYGADMEDRTKDDFGKAMDMIAVWLAAIKDYPGFHEWKIRQLSATMSSGDPWTAVPEKQPTIFMFPPHIDKQHDAVMAFLNLATTWQALTDTQFYFRRYPFQNMPISMDTHLRYNCEMYFSRIYEFSERLKKCLNAFSEVLPKKVDAGAIVKQFAREFRDEIKERNSIHHDESFEELTIRRIMLEGLLASNEAHGLGGRGWKVEQRRSYRKASKEWADRAVKRSARARDYLNAVSRFVTEECTFLTDPVMPIQ